METTKENGLIIFRNEEFGQVRSVTIDNEPWFVGKDVAEALGYKNTKDAILTHVDEEDKRIIQRSEIATFENHIPKKVLPVNFVSADIPPRGLTAINESGLYALIFGSKLESAQRFKRWVTSEVLPTLRKTGTYSMPNMTVSDQIKLLAEGYNEVETRLGEIQGVTQDLSSRVEHIEKTLDVLESNNNTGKLLNLKRAVVAKSYELTAGNGVYEVLWQRNFIANNYSNIKRSFDVARIGQIPASQYDTVMEMARSWEPRDIYLQNKIAEMQGQREENLLDDKKLIALLQYLRDTDDGKINPFKK